MRRLFWLAGLGLVGWAVFGELTDRLDPTYASKLLMVGALCLGLGFAVMIEQRRDHCRKSGRPANDR